MTKLRWLTHADMAIDTRPSVPREEYLDCMTFQGGGRPLFTELFGPLVGLKEEWADQGATEAELDFTAFTYRAPLIGHLPVRTGWLGPDRYESVEETDEHHLYRDHLGRLMKLCKGAATIALPLDYPAKTMDDWLAIKSEFEFTDERLAADWRKVAADYLADGRAIMVDIPGAFSVPRDLMGDEAVCLAYYDQPELIRDMIDTFCDTACRVLDAVSREVQVDILFVHEDMAGKSGPLAGPEQIHDLFAPYYRKVWDMLGDRGARLFEQDSDGDMRPVIDAFLDAGINVMFPCEPAAGMDIVQLREQYGRRLAFSGGIDKHVLRRSREEIVAELEYKIPPMVATGGCVLGLDHRIPNGTPLANYRFYLAKAWEIIDREAAKR
ncbi:MAG: uroporphyrinogen decarboxylase family protein [Planctomycetota bacterium]|jgi:hypothetical protein